MSCSLCSPCFPCGFMKCLKQDNKKMNTSAPSMLESFMFHILQYQHFWYLLSLCHQSRSSAASEGKMQYIVFLRTAKPKDFRKSVELSCKRGLKVFPHKRESIVTFERLFFLGLKVFARDLHL